MKTLFGLKADDYNELPTFVGGVKETPEERGIFEITQVIPTYHKRQ